MLTLKMERQGHKLCWRPPEAENGLEQTARIQGAQSCDDKQLNSTSKPSEQALPWSFQRGTQSCKHLDFSPVETHVRTHVRSVK